MKWLDRLIEWIGPVPEEVIKEPFASMDEIVSIMILEIEADPAAVATWTSTKEEDLILGHHSVGRRIRNKYLLWHEDNPYTDASDPHGPLHPDQFSFEIIKRVHAAVAESDEEDG